MPLGTFLTRKTRIERESDALYDGAVAAAIAFTQLSNNAFIAITPTGLLANQVYTITGTLSGAPKTEIITVTDNNGNRGFQEFDVLTAITCAGSIAGSVKIQALNESSEPLMVNSVIGTYMSDRRLSPEKETMEPFGREDEVPWLYKYYYQPSVPIRENDRIFDVSDEDYYRARSVVHVDSLTGTPSHIEVRVTEFGE